MTVFMSWNNFSFTSATEGRLVTVIVNRRPALANIVLSQTRSQLYTLGSSRGPFTAAQPFHSLCNGTRGIHITSNKDPLHSPYFKFALHRHL